MKEDDRGSVRVLASGHSVKAGGQAKDSSFTQAQNRPTICARPIDIEGAEKVPTMHGSCDTEQIHKAQSFWRKRISRRPFFFAESCVSCKTAQNQQSFLEPADPAGQGKSEQQPLHRCSKYPAAGERFCLDRCSRWVAGERRQRRRCGVSPAVCRRTQSWPRKGWTETNGTRSG